MIILTLESGITVPGLLLLGGTLILSLYHFFLYTQYKERVILAYSLYLLFIVAYIAVFLSAYTFYSDWNYQFIFYLKESMNAAAIITYCIFLKEAIYSGKEKFEFFFKIFHILSRVVIIYCVLYIVAGLILVKNSFFISVLPVIIRGILLIFAFVVAPVIFPRLKERFLQLIKWGALFYLFVVILIMVSYLTPNNKMFGLGQMQLFFLGTFIDIVIFSIAMSYKIKSVLIKLLEVRQKISQDLHDEIGSTLSSIHVFSSVASKVLNNDLTKANEALNQIKTSTQQAMESMNDIVWAIKGNRSGDITLEKKLKNYGYELLSPLNIKCIYTIEPEVEKKMINIEARKNILLIAKEAMNNIAKYSKASETSVKLGIKGEHLELEIEDNGAGFDIDKREIGNGIENMKKRTKTLYGSFQCLTEKGKGTRIQCIIPITKISD